MSENANITGLRLLATYKVLAEEIDFANPLSSGKLREAVAQKTSEFAGRPVKPSDPRTFLRDVETLKRAGFPVEYEGTTRKNYRYEHDFEPWELRFLTDAARASHALTEEQGNKIVERLKGLASKRGRRSLEHRLVVQMACHNGGFKQTAYTLDAVEEAIRNNRKIRYKLYELDADGQPHVKPESDTGNEIRVSNPIEYVYSEDGKYYLIVGERQAGMETEPEIKTPRIDRMAEVEVLDEENNLDLTDDEFKEILQKCRNSFDMFNGPKSVKVQLGLDAKLAKHIRDRFDGVTFEKESKTITRATVTIYLSHTFYSWLTKFKGKVVIEGPDEAVEGMKQFLEENSRAYKTDCNLP